MKNKESKTASELANRLKKDPSYVEQHQSRAKASELSKVDYEREEALILRDINNSGFKLSSLDELLHVRPEKEIVEILIQWLPNIHNENLQETIVRSLAASKTPFSGTVLTNAFEEATSEILRWSIANTIAEARPTGVSEWILTTYKNEKYGKSREMLSLAVARLVSTQKANEVLVSAFNEFPGHVGMALAECGGAVELSFLKSSREKYKGWIRKEIDKAIKKIEERVN